VCVEKKVYTGGRDNSLFVWRAAGAPGGQFQLVQEPKKKTHNQKTIKPINK